VQKFIAGWPVSLRIEDAAALVEAVRAADKSLA